MPTIAQKIIARAAGRSEVQPHEFVWMGVDVLMTHDPCTPGTVGVFKKFFGEDAKIWDTTRHVMIPDHFIFTTDPQMNRNIDLMREFAKEQAHKYFYDVGSPDYKGVCHMTLAQEGHVRPGEVLLGTDSHTCTAGAFGTFATGVGNTDAGFCLGTGKFLAKVPESMRFTFEGEMPKYLMGKDLILHVIGELGVAGATYFSMEFDGPAIEAMSVGERMTVCNMAVEAGAKLGIMAPNEATLEYVKARTDIPFEVVSSDSDAQYHCERVYDVSQLEPTVACPFSPGKRALARELSDVKVTQVYVGSCTGGKLDDFLAVGQAVKGKTVQVPTYGVPATRKVLDQLVETQIDGRPLYSVLQDAGVMLTSEPSCAACCGGPADTFGRANDDDAVCVSTTNRNFTGRMGSKTAQIYLASPLTAAACALRGRITDPRDVLG